MDKSVTELIEIVNKLELKKQKAREYAKCYYANKYGNKAQGLSDEQKTFRKKRNEILKSKYVSKKQNKSNNSLIETL